MIHFWIFGSKLKQNESTVNPIIEMDQMPISYFKDETAIVFVVLNCISTEFTQRRHGGERGAPFRIQADVFKDGDAPYTAANCIQAVSCQVRVFKPRGADRKLRRGF